MVRYPSFSNRLKQRLFSSAATFLQNRDRSKTRKELCFIRYKCEESGLGANEIDQGERIERREKGGGIPNLAIDRAVLCLHQKGALIKEIQVGSIDACHAFDRKC
jgi:hypothetical protein